jgi:hypothetical protein
MGERKSVTNGKELRKEALQTIQADPLDTTARLTGCSGYQGEILCRG